MAGDGRNTVPNAGWLHAAILASCGAALWFCWRVAVHEVVFGSVAGGWVHPYGGNLGASGWIAFLLAAPIACALAWLGVAVQERRESITVLVWWLAALPLQLLLRAPTNRPLDVLVQSSDANSFYTASLQYPVRQYLSEFLAVLPTLPQHAQSNMPGKTLLYSLLGQITDSPMIMGYLVLLVSNVGGVLLYYAIRDLLQDRRVALYSMILYFLIPGKIFFFPLLNTVSPVPLLLAFLVFVRFLVTQNLAWAGLLGGSLYLCLFFDPLPLAAGIIFAVMLGERVHSGRLLASQAGALVLVMLAGLISSSSLVHLATGFDLTNALVHVVEEAGRFNETAHRPYGLWAVRNLFDFGICTGVAVLPLSLVLLGSTATREHGFSQPAITFGVAVVALLAVVDVSGINRGEVIRLWIFIAVFFQVAAALVLAREKSPAWFCTVLAVTIFQIAVTMNSVRFA